MSYRLLNKEVIFTGKKVRLEVHELENDAGRHMRKEICMHPGAVVVLGLPGDGTVVLIRNRRYAVGETLIELPAGTLEAGEEPIVCAGREPLEETGYRAGRIEALTKFYSSPGILSETMHAFVAYDLEKGQPALEEGEEIELLVTPAAQALAMIRDGQITDGKTIATLLYFDRFRKVGQEVWPA
jgi:ADP-ribose pyrophosphatase